ncbi:MAG: AmmeMemoRadiSam system protein B [Sorangium cellulosum]|nr:MAG: AmmeMemoRadiSam system protein B [Sorangium cellulosum]
MQTFRLLTCLTLLVACSKPSAKHDAADVMVRPSATTIARAFGPTVAGRFYPDDPQRLEEMVEGYISSGHANAASADSDRRKIAIVAPHAGYVHSGSTAGVAYAAVSKLDIKTVVILSPSHHGRRNYACLLGADAYRTPLGLVAIAQDLVQALTKANANLLKVEEDLFQPEHAADVHIPFVQKTFPQARVVPIIVPMMPLKRLEQVGEVLHRVLAKNRQALVVISSDLSHFFEYEKAKGMDAAMVEEIERMDAIALVEKHDMRRGPCGLAPIVVSLAFLKGFGEGGKVTRLQVHNSGDVPGGDKEHVVGYPALVFSVPK